MLEKLTEADFANHRGETFKIHYGEGETLEVALVETRGLGSGQRTERSAFSVLFRGGPKDQFLPQATYRLEHPDLGALDLFLVPLGPDDQGMRYEAVFN